VHGGFVRRLRTGLGALLFLSGGLIWLGANSLWFDLYLLVRRLHANQTAATAG
jgi:hypothetical protein